MLNLTGLNKQDAEQFERQTIIAALFRLCDPLRTMENLKVGDTVQLKSGGPIMTLGPKMAVGGYKCQWFNGKELNEGLFQLEQLNKAEPRQPEEPPGSHSVQSY